LSGWGDVVTDTIRRAVFAVNDYLDIFIATTVS